MDSKFSIQRRGAIVSGGKLFGGALVAANIPLQSFANDAKSMQDSRAFIKTKTTLESPYFSDVCDDISSCEIAYPHYVLHSDRILESHGHCEAVLLKDSVIVVKGGWDKDFNLTHKSLRDEIIQAFYNVNTTLQSQGANPINTCYLNIDTRGKLDAQTYAFIDNEVKSYYPKLVKWGHSDDICTENDDIRVLITIKAIKA